MGQANKRGTFEQRLHMAQQRNTSLVQSIERAHDHSAQRALKVYGPQRLALKLQMAGMLYVE